MGSTVHIEKPKSDLYDANKTKENLELFLSQPSPQEVPPCPYCIDHVKSQCTSTCSSAPTALSSHPKEFPIEANVVPLVFGLMSTRVAQTCWSCEGHMDSNNNLIKLPTVSFYTSTPIYSQLLHKHVSKLNMDKKLSYLWHVTLTDYAQTWGQTYSIVPNLNFVDKDIHLGALQNDLKIIAENLQEKMKVIARELITEIDNWIKKNSSKDT